MSTRAEDMTFEDKYIETAKDRLGLYFSTIYQCNSKDVNIVISRAANRSEMDKMLAIDAQIQMPDKPWFTIQIKGRKPEAYQNFLKRKTIPICISKKFPSKFNDSYLPSIPGDFFKCNCDYIFYGFLNDAINPTNYLRWFLIDWATFKKILAKMKNISSEIYGSKYKDYTDDSRIISELLYIPVAYIKHCNCIEADSNTFYDQHKINHPFEEGTLFNQKKKEGDNQIPLLSNCSPVQLSI